MRGNIIVFLIALLFAGSFYYLHLRQRGEIGGSDLPRNETPIGEYTSMFLRQEFKYGKESTRSLAYWWRPPQAALDTPGLKLPLVVVLHGAPGNAYAAAHLMKYERALPAYIVVPVLPPGRRWSDPPRVAMDWAKEKNLIETSHGLSKVAALVRDFSSRHGIDKSRIYVVGCSEGGFGAFGAALYYPELFAASAAFSGGWVARDAARLKTVPMLVIHGAQDTVIPPQYSDDISREMQKAGAPIVYQQVADMGHECSSDRLYGPHIWRWMFSQRKKG